MSPDKDDLFVYLLDVAQHFYGAPTLLGDGEFDPNHLVWRSDDDKPIFEVQPSAGLWYDYATGYEGTILQLIWWLAEIEETRDAAVAWMSHVGIIKPKPGQSEPPKRSEKAGRITVPDSCKDLFLFKLGKDIAKQTEMPVTTVTLMAMAAFSGATSMVYTTMYQDGTLLPIGIFAAGEQPSGGAKSRAIKSVSAPWMREIKLHNKRLLSGYDGESGDPAPKLLPSPISNGTIEGIEAEMSKYGTGHFSAQSAEMGLVYQMFGDGGKSRPINIDLLLKGFVGEFHSVRRVTRTAFESEVYGSVAVFAQANTIDSILDGSNGSGLAERFLMAAEPHNFGNRTFEYVEPDAPLWSGLEKTYSALMDKYRAIGDELKGDIEGLHRIGLESDGYSLIRSKRLAFESKAKKHADRGEQLYLSMMAKLDMQAMKVAANLYLADCLSAGKHPGIKIPTSFLCAAYDFVEAILGHIESILAAKDRMGTSAEDQVIIRLLERDRMPNNLINSARGVVPFKNMAKPREEVRGAIDRMLARGVVRIQPGGSLSLT